MGDYSIAKSLHKETFNRRPDLWVPFYIQMMSDRAFRFCKLGIMQLVNIFSEWSLVTVHVYVIAVVTSSKRYKNRRWTCFLYRTTHLLLLRVMEPHHEAYCLPSIHSSSNLQITVASQRKMGRVVCRMHKVQLSSSFYQMQMRNAFAKSSRCYLSTTCNIWNLYGNMWTEHRVLRTVEFSNCRTGENTECTWKRSFAYRLMDFCNNFDRIKKSSSPGLIASVKSFFKFA